MDASLLNIGIGAIIYIAHRSTTSLQSQWRLLLFVLAGMGTAVFFQAIGFCDFGPALFFPIWIACIAGGLTGALLYGAQSIRLFTHSSMKYSATILVAIVHTFILLGLMAVAEFLLDENLILADQTILALLPLILYSFVSILGFSLPLRLFN